jgi:hypothetical protein
MSEEVYLDAAVSCPDCGISVQGLHLRDAQRRLDTHREMVHRVNGRHGSWSDEAYLRDAAEKLAAARTRYSQEFARFRMRMQSDGAAHQAAIEATKSEITVLEAELKIAERRLS